MGRIKFFPYTIFFVGMIALLLFVTRAPSAAQSNGTVPVRTDFTPPAFVSLTFHGETIDMGDGLQMMLVMARFTDNEWFTHADLRFHPKGEPDLGRNVAFWPSGLVTGDKKDGHYVAGLIVPSLPVATEWVLYQVYVNDADGNYYYNEQKGGLSDKVYTFVIHPGNYTVFLPIIEEN